MPPRFVYDQRFKRFKELMIATQKNGSLIWTTPGYKKMASNSCDRIYGRWLKNMFILVWEDWTQIHFATVLELLNHIRDGILEGKRLKPKLLNVYELVLK